jgi:Sec-independent protein translocase protein TatA
MSDLGPVELLIVLVLIVVIIGAVLVRLTRRR